MKRRSTLDPSWLAQATDSQLAAAFRAASTLPLDACMNEGGHAIDLASRTIVNDEHWKGWLPRGLVLRDIFARLSTGYAKRFWKQGSRYLGETLYLDGRIRVKHALEEITLSRRTGDLDPGRYILLRYTDAVFENVFYDVMKAADDGVIVYGGYTGRFPDGVRGFTGVLMRRYGFAELGVRDHGALHGMGSRVPPASLAGSWALTAVATSNHATPIGTLAVVTGTDAASMSLTAVPKPEVLLPSFVADHFSGRVTTRFAQEVRRVDARTIVGTWRTEVSPLYARLVSATPGLLHRDGGKGDRRFTLRYVLTAEA